MHNEFTRDELEIILDCINHSCATRPFIAGKSVTILDKLQSMLDNFDKDRKVKDSLNFILEKCREWKIEL